MGDLLEEPALYRPAREVLHDPASLLKFLLFILRRGVDPFGDDPGRREKCLQYELDGLLAQRLRLVKQLGDQRHLSEQDRDWRALAAVQL